MSVDSQIALRYRVELCHAGRGAKPVDHLAFVAAGRRRMCAGLRDDKGRTQPALHRFSNRHDVMAAGARIAWGSVVIIHARAAEIEFLELRTVAVPLKDDGLRQVMPDRSAQNDVLADKDGRTAVVLVQCVSKRITADGGKILRAMAINPAVFARQVYACSVVVGLMDRKATRVRMMPVENASRGREE